MDASMSTPATSAPASSTFYCPPCRRPFAGKKEYDRHMKNAKAHFPSGITCYHPGCSKTYQKLESLYTHVGRDHRDEIEALLLERYWSITEVWAPEQHVAPGSNDTSFLSGTPNIIEESHAGFQQMANNTPVSSDATISAVHEAGLSTSSAAFAGLQHMYGNLGLPTGGTRAQQTLPHNDALPPYTMTLSAAGMSTASVLPPSTSQLGTSSTPAGTLDYIYPTLGMLPASVSSYAGLTGQVDDNYRGQEALAMETAYSGPYTILDDDAGISLDDYI